MPWYVIVLIIILFICALFFVPVTLSFKYSEKPDITLYYGFIPIYHLSKHKSRKKKKPKKDKKQNKNEDSKKNSLGSNLKKIAGDDNGLSFVFDVIREITEIVKHTTRDTINNLHIVIKELNVLIASDDAAQTGRDYGLACAAIYPALGFFQSKCRLSIKQMRVAPDFAAGKSNISCHINVWLIPAFFVRILLSALRKWMKLSAKIDRQSLIIDVKKLREQKKNMSEENIGSNAD